MTESEKYLIHCAFCGFNFESESSRKDQECPECGSRASNGGEDIEESKHTIGIKTNYNGVPMDEAYNKTP